MATTPEFDVDRFRPSEASLAWGLLVGVEVLLIGLYLLTSDAIVTQPVILLIPFVWINVGVWAVLRTAPVRTSSRKRWIAGGFAGGYVLVLVALSMATDGGGTVGGLSVSIASLPPGWGPIVRYDGGLIDLVLQPYKAVGYAALGYLVYAMAARSASALAGSFVGLFSCVSCTFPVLASLATGIVGGTAGIAGVVYGNIYLLSTAIYVSAVGLLLWTPGIERLGFEES